MKEHTRQKEKEEAVLLALRECKALIRRGFAVHTIDKDGNTELISESSEYENLWGDALRVLREKNG